MAAILNEPKYRLPLFLTMFVTVALTLACSTSQEFSKHEISFEVSDQLTLEEYTLDLSRQIFRKGPSAFDSGVVMSSEKNFILEWVYEPAFTPQLARAQVLNAPEFYESSNPFFSARISGSPQVKRIAGFEVTFARFDVQFNIEASGQGIIGVWHCKPSDRAIIFIALHNDPTKELNRFVKSFSCG